MARGFGRLATTLSDRAAEFVGKAEVEAERLAAELDAGEAALDNAAAFRADLREDRLAVQAALAPLGNFPPAERPANTTETSPLSGSQVSSAAPAPSRSPGPATTIAPDGAAAGGHETTPAAGNSAPVPQRPHLRAVAHEPTAGTGARPEHEVVARRVFPADPPSDTEPHR
jgi:hypothetical protein